MSNKKYLIIGTAAFLFLYMRNRPRTIAAQQQARQQQGVNNVAGLVNSVVGLFRNTGTSAQVMNVRPGSNVYSGIRPSAQTIQAAANASNMDQNPDVNGSALDWTSTDGAAVNPVTQSPYDAAYDMNQWWN